MNYEKLSDINRLIKKFNLIKATNGKKSNNLINMNNISKTTYNNSNGIINEKTLTEENSINSHVYINNLNNIINNSESKSTHQSKFINTEQSNLHSINNEKEEQLINVIDLRGKDNSIINEDPSICYESKANLNKNPKKYKFINEINQKTKVSSISNSLNIHKLLLIKDYPFLLLLNFLLDDINQLILVKQLQKQISIILRRYYSNSLVKDFIDSFRSVIDFIDFQFDYIKIKEKHKTAYSPSLIEGKLLFKPKQRLIDTYKSNVFVLSRTYFKAKTGIAYSPLEEDELFIQSWKFDIKPRGERSIYLVSELELYKEQYIRQCYTNSITAISVDDIAVITFPAVCVNGIFKHDKWTLSKQQCVDLNERKNLKEFEVVLWKGIDYVSNLKSIKKMIETLKYLYCKCCSISSIEYDNTRTYVIKASLVAIREGVVNKNKIFNFDLIIKKANDTKGCVSYLGSTSTLNVIRSSVEVYVGDKVTLYIDEL